MIPIILCIPVLSSNPNYTCFMPNRVFLVILSIILTCEMFLVVAINGLDHPSTFTIAFTLMLTFVTCTVCFITLAVVGVHNINCNLLTASFWLWCFTWIGYLTIVIYTTWHKDNTALMSIDGRCPVTVWMFDWCMDIDEGKYIPKSENISPTVVPALNRILEKRDGPTRVEISLSFLNAMGEDNEYVKNNSNVIREKRSISEIGVSSYDSTTSYRIAIARYLGTLGIIVCNIALYTMYGATINSINNQLSCPAPFIFIARSRLNPPPPQETPQSQSSKV